MSIIGVVAVSLLLLTVGGQDINTRIHKPGYCMMKSDGDVSPVCSCFVGLVFSLLVQYSLLIITYVNSVCY